MATDPPLQLTFGVELEFLLAYFREAQFALELETIRQDLLVRGANQDEIDRVLGIEIAPEKNRERGKILTRLQNIGVPVHDWGVDGKKDYHRWTVSLDDSVIPSGEEMQSMNPKWANGHVSNLTAEGRASMCYASVEVFSRVLPYNLDSLREVGIVVNTIAAEFPVYVNESCALHVHVGNMDFGFPVQTVKNFATLVTCFENQLNQIHPLHRLDYAYCLPETLAFRPKERDIWRMAEIIDQLNTPQKIIRHFGTKRNDRDEVYHWWCYNYNNLVLAKRTIEFRQHAGTLDLSAVFRWINLACTLTAIAHNSEGYSFLDLILQFIDHERDRNYNIFMLLRSLHLTMLANAYIGRCFKHPADFKPEDPFEEGDEDDVPDDMEPESDDDGRNI
ncbi:hypothetical protein MMC34_004940 [Xylographa carneopallida]|nr:hypothetical protein [Xylographa carneopallida]